MTKMHVCPNILFPNHPLAEGQLLDPMVRWQQESAACSTENQDPQLPGNTGMPEDCALRFLPYPWVSNCWLAYSIPN